MLSEGAYIVVDQKWLFLIVQLLDEVLYNQYTARKVENITNKSVHLSTLLVFEVTFEL